MLQLRAPDCALVRVLQGKGRKGRGQEKGFGRPWSAEILLQGYVPGPCGLGGHFGAVQEILGFCFCKW